MFFKIIFIVLTLSAVGYGIPLEHSSENMAKFFDSRIIGGAYVPKGFAPHMAALIVGTNFIFLACGASIVTPKLLLTAAHCIDAYVFWGELLPSFHGLVGTNTLNLNNQTEGQRVDVESFNIHPEWDWGPIKNDIGFLITSERITMGPKVQPIPLNLREFVEKKPCHVTGFGITEIRSTTINLQVIYKNTITHKDCVERVNDHTGNLGHAVVERDIEVCAFNSSGIGVCNGDSGSALVCNGKQVGIVSWGFPCARGAPDMYTRISGFYYYITEHLRRYR